MLLEPTTSNIISYYAAYYWTTGDSDNIHTAWYIPVVLLSVRKLALFIVGC